MTKSIKPLFILVLFTLFLTPSATLAVNYYIDATIGNNNNEGVSPSKAWKTISRVNESNFHFKPNSPCIDSGLNVGLTRDYDGSNIPIGSAL